MADLPHPWDAYARSQAQLSNRVEVGDRSWGLEAALNRLVVDLPAKTEPLARVRASAERRARYCRALVSRNAPILAPDAVRPDSHIEARSDLVFLARHLSAPEMASLLAAGLGHQAGAGAARQRLSRARRRAQQLRTK